MRMIALPPSAFGGDVHVQPGHICHVRVITKPINEYALEVSLLNGLTMTSLWYSDSAQVQRLRAARDEILDAVRTALEAS